MAKTNTTHLLIPGEISWELWSQTPAGYIRTSDESIVALKPSEIVKIPPGDLIHFFPVRSLTALPMHVPTGDTSLFPDMAETHAERSGLRPDPFAGQLTDIFPILVNSESSTFLNVILRSPQTEDLPAKAARAFDISPRAFPVKGNTLALWRELGQWVFAIHQEGKLLYCQATSDTSLSPDTSVIREIRIAIAQLSMQGISTSPSHAVVWSSDPEILTEMLSNSLSVQTDLLPRPGPILPDPLSRLLPADVRAARREARQRQNTTLAIAAIAVLYLAGVGYLGYQLWQTHVTTQKLQARVTAIAPEGEAYALHIAKWDELEYALNLNYNTVDILNRVAKSIPPNSGLRLRTADISPAEIRLIGEAPQSQPVNQFSLNLTKNNDLLAFDWQTPNPKQSNRGWEFVFTGSSLVP